MTGGPVESFGAIVARAFGLDFVEFALKNNILLVNFHQIFVYAKVTAVSVVIMAHKTANFPF